MGTIVNLCHKVCFENLGCNEATFEKTVSGKVDYGTLYGLVRPHLSSDNIEFLIFSQDENTGIKGRVIVGGFRPVGSFSVIPQ